MAQNFDTLVNPFNAYGIPAFQFAPAAVGTAKPCANCGVTRAWGSFHNELGLYVCTVCMTSWANGKPLPADAVNTGQSVLVQTWMGWAH